MSPLWKYDRENRFKQFKKNHQNQQVKIKQTNPSPNQHNPILSRAHATIKSMKHSYISIFVEFIKEISLLINKRLEAGMAVEASMVLPLFVFFFVNLFCAVEIMRLHGNLQMALWNAGNKMCIYGASLESSEDNLWTEGADIAISYTYLKKAIIDYLGEEYLNQSPLTYGADGLLFTDSELINPDGELSVTLTYQVSPYIKVPGFTAFFMQNRYLSHRWNGYAGTKEDTQTRNYYITENGEVYHCTTECSYLKITKEAITLPQALLRKNESGVSYSLCQKCKKTGVGIKVWITKSGECYHYSEDCPSLKRTIYAVTKAETAGYRPCKRCAEGGE